MASPAAHAADVVVDVAATQARYTVQVNPNTTYQINVHACYTPGCYVVVVGLVQDTTKFFVAYRGPGITRFFNGGYYIKPGDVYRRYYLTNEAGSGVSNDLLSGAVNANRTLVEIGFPNRASDTIVGSGSLMKYSDVNSMVWVELIRNQIRYYAVAVATWTSPTAGHFSDWVFLSGMDFNSFAVKLQTLVNAEASLNAVQGRYRTTMITACGTVITGVVSLGASLGASAALAAGAVATLAGNAVLNGQALIDGANAVNLAWIDIFSFVCAKAASGTPA